MADQAQPGEISNRPSAPSQASTVFPTSYERNITGDGNNLPKAKHLNLRMLFEQTIRKHG